MLPFRAVAGHERGRMDGNSAAPQEIELKFEIEPQALPKLLRHRLLKGAGDHGVRTESLRSVYFDTPDEILRHAGISFRIRNNGSRWVQTIKAGRPSNGLALARDEWEKPVDGDEPDFGLAKGTALEGFLKLRDAIGPRFEIRVERKIVAVTHGTSEIEVALDSGEVVNVGGQERFAEVELELKRGDAGDLFRVALLLADAAPLRLSYRTKADRGFGGAGDGSALHVKAEPIRLKPRLTSAAAFQAIGVACLRHLSENEAILRRARSPEAIHQMRVALRRLRAAISLFKTVVSDERSDWIRAELKWMAGELGAARDLDVRIATILEPARARHEGEEDFDTLLADYRERQEWAHAAARATVDSRRFTRAVLEAAAWIETGGWLSRRGEGDLARDEPARTLAERELTRRRRAIKKRSRRLGAMEPQERHRVRIAVKKLRYACEFFAPLFKGSAAKKRRQATLKVLQDLQDVLGELNDISVADDLGSSPAAEMLRREQAARGGSLLARAEALAGDFADLAPYWRAKA